MFKNKMNAKKGYTLVELLVAMAVASILMAAIVAAYFAQVRAKNSQEMSLEMQQNSRAAFDIMTRELRLAGCDPTGDLDDARILIAGQAELAFSMDIDSDAADNRADGDVCDGNEVIRYHLTNDADDDGVADGTPCNLGRETGAGIHGSLSPPCGNTTSGLQPLVRNIDALNFVYFDEDNNVMATPVAAADLEDIRSVQVTMVARAGQVNRPLVGTYTDSRVYVNQQGTTVLPAQNDQFRRFLLTTTIFFRNLSN